MISKQKDHTGCIIVAVVVIGIGAMIFGVALEVLKFVALAKWVFA